MSRTPQCSFCSRPATEVDKLIGGAGQCICNDCVSSAVHQMLHLDEERAEVLGKRLIRHYHCSFCGKTHGETRALAAGPGVFICDRCLGECLSLMLGDSEIQRVVRARPRE